MYNRLFMSGDARFADFEIRVSENGKDYQTVYDGLSGGKTTSLESFTFPEVKARYVRFVSFGNSVNEWVSLTEVNIPKVIAEYSDVTGHWAREDIMLFTGLGFVNGVSDGLFMPDNPVTRAEFLAIIARSLGLDTTIAYNDEFSGVAASDWYASVLSACSEFGLIPDEMISDSSFNPNVNITREEMVSIISRACKASSVVCHVSANLDAMFADSAMINPAYKFDVETAVCLRLVKGTSPNEFSPGANATRAEAVVMIKRLLTLVYR